MTLSPPTIAMTPASGTRIEAMGTPCAAASVICADEKWLTMLATKIRANSTRPMGTKARMVAEAATDMPAAPGGAACHDHRVTRELRPVGDLAPDALARAAAATRLDTLEEVL